MCYCPPCSRSPLSPVLAELQKAKLITSEECKGMSDANSIIIVQSSKSKAAISASAPILMELGFKEESAFLSGMYII